MAPLLGKVQQIRPDTHPGSQTAGHATAHIQSDEGRSAADAIFRRLGLVDVARIATGGLASAARLVGAGHLGQVVVIELDHRPDSAALDLLRDIAEEVSQLVVIGQQNDVPLFRALMAVGVQDYLVLPLDPQSLSTLIPASPFRATPAAEPTTKTVIGICNCSGGSGASLIAENLAWALSLVPGRQVALVDFDPFFGSVALDLDIGPTQGLLEALIAPARVDQTFLSATMTKLSDTLSIYSGERRLEDEIDDLRFDYAGLAARMQDAFDTVVIDLPREVILRDPAVLGELSHLVLVLSPGYASIRAHARLVPFIEARAPGLSVLRALSQARRDARLGAKEIESSLGHRIDHVFPTDAAGVARAAIKGRPLVANDKSSGFARATRALATAVTTAPSQVKAARGGVIGWLLS